MTQEMRAFYRAEWEATPDLSVEALCSKYNISIKDLGDTSEWEKDRPELRHKPNVIHRKDRALSGAVEAELVETPENSADIEKIKLTLVDTKRLISQEVHDRLVTSRHVMETKELKELALIADTIDKSLKTSNQDQGNINVLVQNIIQNFQDDV